MTFESVTSQSQEEKSIKDLTDYKKFMIFCIYLYTLVCVKTQLHHAMLTTSCYTFYMRFAL